MKEEIFSSMDAWDEMCPIFIESNGNYEHVGTGVLVDIWSNVYLLTAAHVIDFKYINNEELYIPNNNGNFIRINGDLFHNPLTWNQKREDDTIDFSYYKLKEEMVIDIVEIFKPLVEKQICFSTNFVSNVPTEYIKKFENKRTSHIQNYIRENIKNMNSSDENEVKEYNDLLIQNLITFAGYPLTKTDRHDSVTRGEIIYYHGAATVDKVYKDRELNRDENIVVLYGKAGSYKEGLGFANAPKPFGISGGGIYKIVRTKNGFDRELIGIGHTYLSKEHLFIGTNISYCLKIIKEQKLMPYEVYNRLNVITNTLAKLHLNK